MTTPTADRLNRKVAVRASWAPSNRQGALVRMRRGPGSTNPPFPLHRLAGGVGLVVVCGALQLIMGLSYNVVLGRALGVADYGRFVLLLTGASLIAQVAVLGRDTGVLRFGAVARAEGNDARLRAVIWRSVRTVAAAGTVAAALAIAVAVALHLAHGPPWVAPVVALVGASVPVSAVLVVVQKALRVTGAANVSVILQYVAAPASRLVWLLLLLVLPGLTTAILAFTAAEVTTLLLATAVLRGTVPRSRTTIDTPGLQRFSLAMAANTVLGSANEQSETLLVAALTPASELGAFGAARRLSLLLAALLSAVGVHLAPLSAAMHASGQTDELVRVFRTCTRWLLTLGLPICLVEVLLAHEVVSLFGEDFAGAAVPLAVMAVGQLVNVATGTAGGLLAMTGAARITVRNTVAVLILSLILDLLLIPRYGIVGAAAANAAAVAALNLMRALQVRRHLGLHLYDHTFVKPLVAGAAAAGCVPLLPPMDNDIARLSLGITVLGVVYVVVLVLLRPENDDREVLRRLLGTRLSRTQPPLN